MKNLVLLLLLSLNCVAQEISDADWLAYFAAPKQDKKWKMVTLGNEGSMVSRYKGEVRELGQTWEKYVSVTDVGPVKNMQMPSLTRVDLRGLIDNDEGKEIVLIPRPLKINQEWKKGDVTVVVAGIKDFETVEATEKECLVIEFKEKGKVTQTKYYQKGFGLIHSESPLSTFSLIKKNP